MLFGGQFGYNTTIEIGFGGIENGYEKILLQLLASVYRYEKADIDFSDRKLYCPLLR